MIKKIQTLILIGLCAFITPTVLASDGVIEINQTCATQLGCFSGDVAGFPVTILGLAGNSYRLTSNLSVGANDVTAISINTGDINIDLNGFKITCVIANCKSNSSGMGIDAGFSGSNILVKNGLISSFGGGGIQVASNSKIYNMNINNNGGHGIRAGSYSILKNNIVDGSNGHGILGSSLFGSALGLIISNNVSNNNGSSGIKSGKGSSINSNITINNTLNGIDAGAGSNVQSNTIRNNSNFGLNLDATAIYQQNVMTGNTSGSVSGGVNMGQNYCNTQVCP